MNIHELPAIMYICIYQILYLHQLFIYIIYNSIYIHIYIYHFRSIYSMFVCYFAMETPIEVKDFEPEVSLSWFPPRSKEEWHRRMDGCQVLSEPWPVSWPNSCTQSQKICHESQKRSSSHESSRFFLVKFSHVGGFRFVMGVTLIPSILDFLKWGLP